MRSYDEATESKTSLTSDSLDSSGTVLNPKDVVRRLEGSEDDDDDEGFELSCRTVLTGRNLGKATRSPRERDSIICRE